MIFPHHELGIQIITDILKEDKSVLAILIVGSIAHKTAEETSDIDIMIILSDEDYNIRNAEGKTWEGKNIECEGFGKIFCDIKYISISYMDKVTKYGNEPSRFAFEGAFASFSKIDDIDNKLKKVCKYPMDKKQSNMDRFYAQLKAWYWFCGEALKKNNKYLLNMAVSKLILFGGRLILAYNEILYPYHKWFVHELEKAAKKPENLIELINTLLADPNKDNIDAFYNSVDNYHKWYEGDVEWPTVFISDSEQTWIDGNAHIDDI